jgi:hypothetical protein
MSLGEFSHHSSHPSSRSGSHGVSQSSLLSYRHHTTHHYGHSTGGGGAGVVITVIVVALVVLGIVWLVRRNSDG